MAGQADVRAADVRGGYRHDRNRGSTHARTLASLCAAAPVSELADTLGSILPGEPRVLQKSSLPARRMGALPPPIAIPIRDRAVLHGHAAGSDPLAGAASRRI